MSCESQNEPFPWLIAFLSRRCADIGLSNTAKESDCLRLSDCLLKQLLHQSNLLSLLCPCHFFFECFVSPSFTAVDGKETWSRTKAAHTLRWSWNLSPVYTNFTSKWKHHEQGWREDGKGILDTYKLVKFTWVMRVQSLQSLLTPRITWRVATNVMLVLRNVAANDYVVVLWTFSDTQGSADME